MEVSFDVPRWTTGRAADAAGIPVSTASNWISPSRLKEGRRPVIEFGDHDAAPGEAGGMRLWSLRRVLQLAITAALVQQNIPPATAARLAFAFTDSGSAYSGPRKRLPGTLFPTSEGLTLLVVDGDDARVVAAQPEAPLTEAFGRRFNIMSRPVLTVVNLNFVIGRVFKTLGLEDA
jgi:hypothetical protein